MSHSNCTPRNRRHQSLLVLVAVLLGAVAFGSFASVARADDPLMPPAGLCANDGLTAIVWNRVDVEREAVGCLINQVRLRAHLPYLLQCQSIYTCNLAPMPQAAYQNAINLDLAAQWKAMDVDYGVDESPSSPCTAPYNGAPSVRMDIINNPYYGLTLDPKANENVGTLAFTYAIPHYACSRPFNYWDTFTHVSYSYLSENLAVGFNRSKDSDGVIRDHYKSPRDVVNQWLNELPPNDGHRKAILDPLATAMGIGVSPAANGNIFADPINNVIVNGKVYNIGGGNWGYYRQVYSAQFIR
jgi:hypothetical protein